VFNQAYCCFNPTGQIKACWRLTRWCNLGCQHCFADAEHSNQRRVSDNVVESVLSELVKRRVTHLVLSGGEPLVLPALPEVVGRAVRLGIRTTIATNAVLATDDRISRLRAAGLSGATVSLDHAYAESYAKIRGTQPGMFQLVTHGLSRMARYKIPLSTNTMLHPLNLLDLGLISAYAIEHGAQVVAFTVPVCIARTESSIAQRVRPALGTVRETLLELALKYPSTRFELHDPQCYSGDCPAGKEILGITERGEFVSCLVKSWLEVPAGLSFAALSTIEKSSVENTI
jgi:MoaA/NifB/PqqE/SkfB family radical SAM enzyme